jgi:hypothetical protein
MTSRNIDKIEFQIWIWREEAYSVKKIKKEMVDMILTPILEEESET